jgi:hypothetical protein
MLEAFFSQLNGVENPDITCQQDGAVPHFNHVVQDALTHKFPERWTGRGGQILWPPCTPDLTPLDLFMCGRAKNAAC